MEEARMADPVVHFEIQSKMQGELQKFYAGAFGWNISEMTAGGVTYAVIETQGGEGINGGIGPAMQGSSIVTLYVAVEKLEDSIAKAEKLGGRTLLEPSDVMEGLRLAM